MAADTLLRFLEALLILTSTYLVNFLFGKIVIGAVSKRNRSVAYEISSVGGIVIWTAGILLTLPVLGASDTVVSVVILLVGAFLILASRDFTSNWFAGQSIKKIAPFRIGDWIRSSETYGRVVKIDDLYTTIVTRENETVVIPNSRLASDAIIDRSTNGFINVPVEVEVPSSTELQALTQAFGEIAHEVSSNFSDIGEKEVPEIYILGQSLASVRVRVNLKVNNPAREEEAKSEFRRRISELQRPEGVRRPT
ncbi:MAG TPA: mechanosensitive ion channel family protein [Nitrososphaerales archaeon]|nr:mechanosensitive ion channel family protein [Nitrososphaerales archaeon]